MCAQHHERDLQAEGYEFDTFAMMYVSDGLGSRSLNSGSTELTAIVPCSVDDVPWMGLLTAQKLHKDNSMVLSTQLCI